MEFYMILKEATQKIAHEVSTYFSSEFHESVIVL